MNHWRKPTYTIETEFGTLRNVSEDDAELAGYEFARDPDSVRFVMREEPRRLWYFPGMLTLIGVIIIGLRYLFGG